MLHLIFIDPVMPIYVKSTTIGRIIFVEFILSDAIIII